MTTVHSFEEISRHYNRSTITIEMFLCIGCMAVWIPEGTHHCDGCIDHAKHVLEAETGGES